MTLPDILTPAEFRALRVELFGNYGGQRPCAEFLRRWTGRGSTRTIRRWEAGEMPVPFWVKPLFEAERKRREEAAAGVR